MDIRITKKELQVRKSQGTVYLCKNCSDRGILTLIAHVKSQKGGVVYGLCDSCMGEALRCPFCAAKK